MKHEHHHVTAETDGHVHDWFPGLGVTSVNYHLDGTRSVSLHTHASDLLETATMSSLNENADGFHSHLMNGTSP